MNKIHAVSFIKNKKGWKTKINGKWFFLDRQSVIPVSGIDYHVSIVHEKDSFGFVKILGPVYCELKKKSKNEAILEGEDSRFKALYKLVEKQASKSAYVKWNTQNGEPEGLVLDVYCTWKVKDRGTFDREYPFKSFYQRQVELVNGEQFTRIIEEVKKHPVDLAALSNLPPWKLELIRFYRWKDLKGVIQENLMKINFDKLLTEWDQLNKLTARRADIRLQISKHQNALDTLIPQKGYTISNLPSFSSEQYLIDFIKVWLGKDGKIEKVIGISMNDRTLFGETIETWVKYLDVTHNQTVREFLRKHKELKTIMNIVRENEGSVEKLEKTIQILKNEERKIDNKILRKEEEIKQSKTWQAFEQLKSHPLFKAFLKEFSSEENSFLDLDPDPVNFKRYLEQAGVFIYQQEQAMDYEFSLTPEM